MDPKQIEYVNVCDSRLSKSECHDLTTILVNQKDLIESKHFDSTLLQKFSPENRENMAYFI